MAKVMDEETLQYIMRSITTNDRELQRHIVQQYLTDDVKFTHFLGDVQGRDAVYGVYRAAVSGIDYKLKFIEMVLDHDTAAVWVDLNIKLAPFYIKRYHAPTIVLLRYRRGADGLLRICEQIDHHSIFVFMWALGWPFSAIWDYGFRQVQGHILSTTGWAIDAAEDAATLTLSCWLSTTGWLLGNTLPAPVIQGITQVLPEGLVRRLGFDRVLASGRETAGSGLAAVAGGDWNTSSQLSTGGSSFGVGGVEKPARDRSVDSSQPGQNGGLMTPAADEAGGASAGGEAAGSSPSVPAAAAAAESKPPPTAGVPSPSPGPVPAATEEPVPTTGAPEAAGADKKQDSQTPAAAAAAAAAMGEEKTEDEPAALQQSQAAATGAAVGTLKGLAAAVEHEKEVVEAEDLERPVAAESQAVPAVTAEAKQLQEKPAAATADAPAAAAAASQPAAAAAAAPQKHGAPARHASKKRGGSFKKK